MLFNSFPFIFLVLITMFFYYQKSLLSYQRQILIISSSVFYAYGQPSLLLLLMFSASINSIISYLVYFEKNISKKRGWAIFGVAFNLLILIYFKYIGLFVGIFDKYSPFNDVGEFFILIPLPIGISFYTFQGISLVVDLYRKDSKKQKNCWEVERDFSKHFLDTIFFISFFPQLIAGPIVKAYQFYPQIQKKVIKGVQFEKSFKLLIVGYFFKMVVADNLKDQTFWMMYPYFESLSSINLLVLLIGYSMQIFSDFAGYSLIAIGVAKLYGYNLSINFCFPYIAKSFSEFWTRWHISLSTWLKEYLYIPLGGNKKGNLKTYLNLMLVMAFGGLWHGAAISYMVWGIYHGLLLSVERFVQKNIINIKTPLFDYLKVFIVFSFVTIGWLLFKLPNFFQVLLYLKAFSMNFNISINKLGVFLIICYSLPIIMYHLSYLIYKKTGKNYLDNSFTYSVMLFLIVTNSGSSGEFIYFQF
ncbi:MAG: membrane-bound O-acyltransferase family protein [Candidatus Cloacimonadota bacterium]|nr:MAG: membrane-bound O-acyltransferase family protein [Candidatus Cloacimonadota bacterium]